MQHHRDMSARAAFRLVGQYVWTASIHSCRLSCRSIVVTPHGAARPAVLERCAEAEGGVQPSVRLHHVLKLARGRLPRTICNAFIPHCRPSPGPAASRGRLLISFTRVTREMLWVTALARHPEARNTTCPYASFMNITLSDQRSLAWPDRSFSLSVLCAGEALLISSETSHPPACALALISVATPCRTLASSRPNIGR